MTGFLFRLGVYIKDAGERMRFSFLVDIGLRLREYALKKNRTPFEEFWDELGKRGRNENNKQA